MNNLTLRVALRKSALTIILPLALRIYNIYAGCLADDVIKFVRVHREAASSLGGNMKDSLATGLLVLWVCVLLAARTQQQQLPECPLITAEELGSTTVASRVGFISSFFRIGESGIPLVQLFNFHIVCFHSGTTRNMYRGLSVVANYSCSDGNMTFDLY